MNCIYSTGAAALLVCTSTGLTSFAPTTQGCYSQFSLNLCKLFPVTCDSRSSRVICRGSASMLTPTLAPSSSRDSGDGGCSSSTIPGSRALPPWILHGRGYVFPFSLPKESTSLYCSYAEDPRNLLKFVGGVGGLVLSDYHDSPVGPYKELVFLPGLYQHQDSSIGAVKKAHSISRIWVDNEKSMEDARANWGIPKELAVFEWRQSSPSQPGRVTVRRPSASGRGGVDDVIFDVVVNDNYAPFSVPIWTKVPLLPLDILDFLPLVQLPLDGGGRGDEPHLLKTTLSLHSWMKPAAMPEKPRVDSSLLPSVGALYGLSLTSFQLQFKKPIKLVR